MKTDAWKHSDVKTYNLLVKKTISTVQEMKEIASNRQEFLLPLMQNSDPYVRLSAAYYCLGIAREQAVSTLRALDHTVAGDHASVVLWDIEHKRG